jgi:PAS domain S-box-containing protein
MNPSDTNRVLVADDDEPLAELVIENFEQQFQHIEGTIATSVDEGFEKFKEEDIDAIVSDYDFRGEQLDGLDFLEKVRQVDSEFPFVLFTGKGGEEIAERAISKGVSTYVRKQSGVSQYGVLANTVLKYIEGYKAKRENERRLSALEVAEEGIAIIDENARIEYANNAFLDLFGYRRSELIGEEWAQLHPEEEIERFYDDVLPNLRSDGEWKGETTGITKDGSTFAETKSISTLEGGGLVIVSIDLEALDKIAERIEIK